MKKGEKYRKAVFIVTYLSTKQGIEYLILKRKLHWKGWEFPKGKIERFETKRKTVKRELKEETGLTPIKIKKFNIKGKYKYQKILLDRPNYRGQTYELFSAEVKNKKVKVDNYEHTDYKWLSFKKVIKKLTWPNQRKCLKIVNNFINES